MCILNVTKIKNIQNIQVMANQNKTDIGLIGLAVMGENLALNMESKGCLLYTSRRRTTEYTVYFVTFLQ